MSEAEPAAVDARGLTRRFGGLLAVNDVSLSVPRGCFYGFLGPNGAGKSTFIRLLTGLLPPSSGDAVVEGHSIVKDALAVKRCIGVVPDDLALFDRLSLFEHLTMVGPIYGLSRQETDERARGLLKLLDLWDARGTQAADASHGMRKKLSLAVALLPRPALLFLDEPFEGVDPIAARVLRDLLKALTQRGITVFMTSHILAIVEQLTERVGIINAGRLVAETSMDELRASGESLEDVFAHAVGASTEPRAELPWLL